MNKRHGVIGNLTKPMLVKLEREEPLRGVCVWGGGEREGGGEEVRWDDEKGLLRVYNTHSNT